MKFVKNINVNVLEQKNKIIILTKGHSSNGLFELQICSHSVIIKDYLIL